MFIRRCIHKEKFSGNWYLLWLWAGEGSKTDAAVWIKQKAEGKGRQRSELIEAKGGRETLIEGVSE